MIVSAYLDQFEAWCAERGITSGYASRVALGNTRAIAQIRAKDARTQEQLAALQTFQLEYDRKRALRAARRGTKKP
jgi:hypothetical protein